MQKIIVGGGVGGARFLGIHFDLDKKVEFAIRGQTKKKRRAKNDDSEAIKNWVHRKTLKQCDQMSEQQLS